MAIAIAVFLLAALTGFLVWRAADRFWHFLVIVALAAALFPLVAHGPAGDVSRYLPSGLFPDGADGKDQVVLASAAATVLISAVLAAGLWTAVTTVWRRMRTTSLDKPRN
jgi:hypothetical protein